MAEHDMVRQHHQFNEHEFGQTLGDSGGQKSLVCCSPWDLTGKNTGVSCHFLFQRIFLTQRWKPHLLCLLHWQVDSLPLSHLGSP